MTFRVVHTTTYRYESSVSASYGEAHLLPRDMPGQRVLSADLRISPTPGDLRERRDYFGNRTHYFSIADGHTRLQVTATSTVEVQGRGLADQLLADQPWEAVRDQIAAGHVRGADGLAAVELSLGSAQAPTSAAAVAYGLPSFRPGRPILEAVAELSSRIHREFEFRPGSTTVGTPVEVVLGRRAGVCQDFAHLTIAMLRAAGIAARYVSGYFYASDPTQIDTAEQGEIVVATHAWVEAAIPDRGWWAIDPTNAAPVGERHVEIGHGRDYDDVTPLRGVYFGDAKHLLAAEVAMSTGSITRRSFPAVDADPQAAAQQ